MRHYQFSVVRSYLDACKRYKWRPCWDGLHAYTAQIRDGYRAQDGTWTTHKNVEGGLDPCM